mmetsp:Transcript_21524/g.40327  ORF Transcript_21524/g.40327 Transcript_21524/m.40327 type:complete len:206 (-) Transcript_21524:141-758(-)
MKPGAFTFSYEDMCGSRWRINGISAADLDETFTKFHKLWIPSVCLLAKGRCQVERHSFKWPSSDTTSMLCLAKKLSLALALGNPLFFHHPKPRKQGLQHFCRSSLCDAMRHIVRKRSMTELSPQAFDCFFDGLELVTFLETCEQDNFLGASPRWRRDHGSSFGLNRSGDHVAFFFQLLQDFFVLLLEGSNGRRILLFLALQLRNS